MGSHATAEVPATPEEKAVRMNTEVADDLVGCGVLVAGLCLAAQHVRPDLHPVTLFSGLAGGGLCVVGGILGRRGTRYHGVVMVTLAAMACVFARQAVLCWNHATESEAKSRIVMAVMAVLVVFCAGTVINLVRERKKDSRHE